MSVVFVAAQQVHDFIGAHARLARAARGSQSTCFIDTGRAGLARWHNAHRTVRRVLEAYLVPWRKAEVITQSLRNRDLSLEGAVGHFWVALRTVAEARLLELQEVVSRFIADPSQLAPLDRKAVLGRARQGEVVVIDVRPADEFAAGHLPYARSIPLTELKKRLGELPRNKDIVAHCRGPFCLMAGDAVALLRKQGFRTIRFEDGMAEWRSAGLPVESGTASPRPLSARPRTSESALQRKP